MADQTSMDNLAILKRSMINKLENVLSMIPSNKVLYDALNII